MMGKLDRQICFDDVSWRERIPKETFWWKVHNWASQSLDEKDFEPLFSNTGRPSVSPIHTLLAILIQLEKGYSDREIEEESRYDERVKLAMLAGRNFEGVDAVTLAGHRKMFIETDIGRNLLEKTLRMAKEQGLFTEEKRTVIDSFMVGGATAVQDTYTLIRKAIMRTLHIARCHEMADGLQEVLKRDDYHVSEKPKIDCDDEEEKRRLLESLVFDALALVNELRRRPMPPDLEAMVNLLERVATQDVKIKDGRVEMVKGVAKDRVISVNDPEMRHGRKTSSAKNNGYKAHVLTGGKNAEIVMDVEVTPANVPDKEPLPDMLDEQGERGRRPERVLGDSSYHDPRMCEQQEKKGTLIEAKVPPPTNRQGLNKKDEFRIDVEKGSVQCPAGQTVQFDTECFKRREGIQVSFDAALCNSCKYKSQCTNSENGRTIRIHPYEPEIQSERERQRTEAFKADYAYRANAERTNAHLCRHGGRKARYIGLVKTKFQILMASVLHNIKVIMRTKSTCSPSTA